jgi:hypothetical protein
MSLRTGWTGRVLIGAVSIMVLVAVMTLPGLAAPSKTMTFKVNTTGPTTANFNTATNAAPGGTQNVSFWVRAINTTPGTGNPNSLRVTPPTTPSGFVITGAQVDNANSTRNNPNVTYAIGAGGAYVDINGIAPLQQNDQLTVRIFASTPAVSCPGPVTSSDWTGKLWTGSSVGSGQGFNTTASSGTKTTLAASCPALVFVTAPHDAATNTKITGTDFDPDGTTVQVAYQVNGSTSNARDGSTVTITEDGAGAISGNTGVLSGGVVSFAGLQIDKAGDYNLTAGLPGGPSSSPVAITITPAGVCPNSGVSGQEDFSTPDFGVDGQGTLNIADLTSSACAGLGITFTQNASDTQQWTIDEVKHSPTDRITGYATWIWDQPGTDAIPWTQIKWNHNDNGTLRQTDFVDLPRCNANKVTNPMPSPTLPNTAYTDLFPTVTTSLGDITAGACVFNSSLNASASSYIETQQVAIFEDLGGRKG